MHEHNRSILNVSNSGNINISYHYVVINILATPLKSANKSKCVSNLEKDFSSNNHKFFRVIYDQSNNTSRDLNLNRTNIQLKSHENSQ